MNARRPLSHAHGASIAAVTAELAVEALRASLAAAPRTFAVSWFEGEDGARTSTAELDVDALAAELRARLAVPHPKGAPGADALLPARTDPTRTDRRRSAIETVAFAIVDVDRGALTLGEAVEVLRAVGLGAFAYPSPSAPSGPALKARKFRLLVPLAAGVTGKAYDLLCAVVRDAFCALFGEGVDRAPFRPEALSYVHPRPYVLGGRAPCDLVVVSGAALDVAALADAATLAGWWHHEPAKDARGAGVRDGAALVAVLRAAGVIVGDATARGFARAVCPRDLWHGSRAPTRNDTSTVVHEPTGAFVCSHDHSAAPAAERGPANTSTLLRWLRADRPDLAPVLALALDAGRLGETRAALREAPFGEAPRRVVQPAAVGDDTADALAAAMPRHEARSPEAPARCSFAPLARIAGRFQPRPPLPEHGGRSPDGAPASWGASRGRAAPRCETWGAYFARLVLYTPTVGAGKSYNAGQTVARALRGCELLPAVDAAAPLPSAQVTVRDRDALVAAAASCLRAGLAVRVHTPVHQVLRPDGAPACKHRPLALRVYNGGGNARASVCPSVPGLNGAASKRCEHYDECPARDPWVSWRLDGEGLACPDPSYRPPLGEQWVAITTHAASTVALRMGAPLVVDESDVALRPVGYSLTAEGLDAALAWAEILAPARVEGSNEPTAAPRIVATAVARAARAAGVEYLAALPAAARVAWAATTITHDPALKLSGNVHDLERWAPVEAAEHDVGDVATAAVIQWVAKGASAHAVSLRAGALPPGGADPLRALARWVGGCNARLVAPDGEPPALALAWRSGVAEACVATLARGGGVLALDATGDPSIARAAVGDALVVHEPVRVDGGAEVRRVLVSTSRAARRHLAPRGGAVDWTEHALPALRAGLGALRGSWRDGFGIGEGLACAPRQLALACSALAAVGLDAAPVEVRAEVERQCAAAGRGKGAPVEVQARATAWALAAPVEVRRVLAELATHGPVHWTYYGATDARGSNVHQHRAWCLALGDARPASTSTHDALWAMTGAEPSKAEVHTAMNSAAAREAAQVFGRLRAVQREGWRLACVAVAKVPPLDWHELPEPPLVVSPAGAWQWGAAADAVPAAVELPAAEVEAIAADAVRVPEPTAHLDVHRAHAAGWGLGEVASAAGVDASTARAWWRGERPPSKARHLDALAALADGRGTPTLRATLRRLTSGRGWHTVWLGSHGAVGLAARLRGAGVDVDLATVRAWAELPARELPPAVVGAVAAVLPALAVVFPPSRPLPAPLRQWPPVEVGAVAAPKAPEARPRTVRARPPVEAPAVAPSVVRAKPHDTPRGKAADDG